MKKKRESAGRKMTVEELERAPRFPNLLQDRDFVLYSWTLPFAVL